MSQPDITAAERAAVMQVIDSPILALGPRMEEFERTLAARVGARHGIAVSSGTAGLHLCMIAAGVGAGDCVLTSSFSFVASANCALYVGAKPVFVDIDPVTLMIDPAALEVAIAQLARDGERPKAILPIHVFGQAADMDAIGAIAKRHGLAVIEDACEALGAEYKGRPVGALGDAGVFAFYPNKQMTTGEGGMIVTDDADWDTLFRSLRNQGRDVFDGWLAHSRLGYNYRLDELSAALGAVQVARLDELLRKRERVAARYDERLAGVEAVSIPSRTAWTTRVSWFVYVIRVDAAIDRDALIVALERRGIPARPYFPPIHLQPFYRERYGFRGGELPATEAAGSSCLALPFFGNMRDDEIESVCTELEAGLAEPGVRARPHRTLDRSRGVAS